MKKTIRRAAYLCALILCTGVFSGCGASDTRPSIVCSSALVADWTSAVLGEEEDLYALHVLGARGSDIHSYEPTVRDIARIAECSLFIRIGGESEDWAHKVVKSADNPRMRELALLETLEANLDGNGHDHEHSRGSAVSSDEDGHAHHADEHIWFSLDYVCESVELIAHELSYLRPESSETYEKNAQEYIARIRTLEDGYAALRESADIKRIVVCDRFPYLYLAEFMELEYRAAFEGCSAESEASFSVISTLARKADEWQVDYVIKTESSDGKIARSVISAAKNKNIQILTLDSMQSATEENIKERGYLDMLESNLRVLETALSK